MLTGVVLEMCWLYLMLVNPYFNGVLPLPSESCPLLSVLQTLATSAKFTASKCVFNVPNLGCGRDAENLMLLDVSSLSNTEC